MAYRPHVAPTPEHGVIPQHRDPTRPDSTTVKVYEFNPKKKLEAGVNPIQIAATTIPFEVRLPRREERAVEAVTRLTGRVPSIAHAANGEVIATVYVIEVGSG